MNEQKSPGRPCIDPSKRKQHMGGRLYTEQIELIEQIFGSFQAFLDDAANRLNPNISGRYVALDKKALELIERRHGSLQQFISAEVRWLKGQK